MNGFFLHQKHIIFTHMKIDKVVNLQLIFMRQIQ